MAEAKDLPTTGSEDEAPKGGRRCPICGAPEAARYRPFCSKRCADIDLGRWLKGNYRIPVEEEPESEEGGASPDTPSGGAGGGGKPADE
ncbi:MAG: DNA gyrase inhibitor YacG [Proteobacteria bacterium]|nr:DNA gyrase inhibitor YacG [Pseudomonadota bacterium]